MNTYSHIHTSTRIKKKIKLTFRQHVKLLFISNDIEMHYNHTSKFILFVRIRTIVNIKYIAIISRSISYRLG